jgi:hypothetical protein
MFGSTYTAIKGDAYVVLQYLAFGGETPRPDGLVARALTWLIMKRLTVSTAAGPTPTPGPTFAPVTAARALVGRVRAEPFGDDNVDATIELLARSGIGTYATPDAAEPIVAVEGVVSPLALLRDQVRAMALEAWAGGGILGSELDPVVPETPDLASASYILASYVAAVDTEGAQVARALMGEQDWDQAPSLVYPQLVLTLFASDIARDRMAEAGVTRVPQVRVAEQAMLSDVRTAQAGACTLAKSFLDASISRLFESLRLGDPGGGNVLKQIWNFFVSIAERVFRAVVGAFTQRVLNFIGEVAAVAAMAASIVSAIRPWTVVVTTQPNISEKGVGGRPGQDGRIVARVDLGGFDEWPKLVKDCAEAAGRPLPNLRPEGAQVLWEPIIQTPAGLLAEGRRETRLDANGVARLDFVTLVDDVPEPWQTPAGTIQTRVTVVRPQLEQLRELAVNELFAALGEARPLVEPFLRQPIDNLLSRIDGLISKSASDFGYVIYHVPAPTPRPDESPEPAPEGRARAVWATLERPAEGPIRGATVIEFVSCSGPYGEWSGVLRVGGIGPVRLAELPVEFSFRAGSGVQVTQTSTQGKIPWIQPGIAYDAFFILDLSTDGETLTVTTTGRVDEEIQGQDLLTSSGSGGTQVLPIEPAPPEKCAGR